MQIFVQEIMNLFGLAMTPTSNDFVGLVCWFVVLMSGICITCGVVKMMFFIALNARKVV